MLLQDNAHINDNVVSQEHKKPFTIYYAKSINDENNVPVKRLKPSILNEGDILFLFDGMSPILQYKYAYYKYKYYAPDEDLPSIIYVDDYHRWEMVNVSHQIKNDSVAHAPLAMSKECYEVWQSKGSSFHSVLVRDKGKLDYKLHYLWDKEEEYVFVPHCIENNTIYPVSVELDDTGDNLLLFNIHNNVNFYELIGDSYDIIYNEFVETIDLPTNYLRGAFFVLDGDVLFTLDHIIDGTTFLSKAKQFILSGAYQVDSYVDVLSFDLEVYNEEYSDLIHKIGWGDVEEEDSGVLLHDYKFSNDGRNLHLLGQNKEMQSQSVWFFDNLKDSYVIDTGQHEFFLKGAVIFKDNYNDDPKEGEFIGSAWKACKAFASYFSSALEYKFDISLDVVFGDLIYKIFDPSVGSPIDDISSSKPSFLWSAEVNGLPSDFPLRYLRFDFYQIEQVGFSDYCFCSVYTVVHKNIPTAFEILSYYKRALLPHKEHFSEDSFIQINDFLQNSVHDYQMFTNFTYVDDISLASELDHNAFVQCNVPVSMLLIEKDDIPISVHTKGLMIPRFAYSYDVEDVTYKAYGLHHLVEYNWEHPFWLQYVSELIFIHTGQEVPIEIIYTVYKQFMKSIDKGGCGRLPDFDGLCHWCDEIASGNLSSGSEFETAFAEKTEVTEGQEIIDSEGDEQYKYKKLVGDVTYQYEPISISEDVQSTVYYNNVFVADYNTGNVKQYWLSNGLSSEYGTEGLDCEVSDCVGYSFPKFNPMHVATYNFGFKHVTDIKIRGPKLYVTGNDPNKTCQFYLTDLQEYLVWRYARVGDLTHYFCSIEIST